jgi:hypothetical protein
MLVGACDGTTTEDSMSCVPCDPGTYSVGGSSTACLECPAGFYSDLHPGQCLPCPAGTYSAPGSAECTPCTEWQCSPGEYRSVCTGSEPGICGVVPRWTKLSISPVYPAAESYVPAVSAGFVVSAIGYGRSDASSLGVTYASNDEIPKLSYHAAAAISRGIVFIFGGRLYPKDPAAAYQRSNRLYGLHTAYASVPAWWKVTADEGPPPREMHAMAAVGSSVYVCGGLGGASLAGKLLSDLWVYVHVPRQTGAVGVSSGDIIFGGSWSLRARAALPDKLAQHRMVSTPDGKLWVFGGQTTGDRVLDKLMSLDAGSSDAASWTAYTWARASSPQTASEAGSSSGAASVFAPAARREFGMAAVGYTVCVSVVACLFVFVFVHVAWRV